MAISVPNMSTAKKSDARPRETQVRLKFPITSYRRAIYANRVAVEKTAEKAAIITFALQAKTGTVVDHERVVMSPEGLARHRQGMVAFLDRLGVDDPALPQLPPLSPGPSMGVADEFLISTGGVSEAIFTGFSVGALSTEPSTNEIPLEGILRVQAAPVVFQKLIRLLYLDDPAT